MFKHICFQPGKQFVYWIDYTTSNAILNYSFLWTVTSTDEGNHWLVQILLYLVFFTNLEPNCLLYIMWNSNFLLKNWKVVLDHCKNSVRLSTIDCTMMLTGESVKLSWFFKLAVKIIYDICQDVLRATAGYGFIMEPDFTAGTDLCRVWWEMNEKHKACLHHTRGSMTSFVIYCHSQVFLVS